MISSSVISRGESSLGLNSSPTVWLYQLVLDIWIGKDDQGADIFMSYRVDLYYSQEHGGRNATYSWSEWETTKKELRIRGYDYLGKLMSRATKEGQDLEKTCQSHLDYVVEAVRTFDPNNSVKVEVHYIPQLYTPTWIYLTLIISIFVMGFIVLQLSNR